MKRYIYLFIIGVIMIGACGKNTEFPIEESVYWGETVAKKNGGTWNAEPYARININHGNGINMSSDILLNGLAQESLSFNKIPFVPGTYPAMNTNPAEDDGIIDANFAFLDHDVVLGVYEILESDSSSFITLSSYDTITQEIKGSFDLTFIVDRKNETYNFPDTVRFRNGRFHTKVTEL